MHLRFTGGPLAALLRTPTMRAQERQARGEAAGLLEDIGLADLQDVDAGRLTFGQLRFLEIARALAARPRLLLLDEPTAGLNTVESDSLASLITSISGRGVGLLVVDHNVPFLFAICDRITVMNYGSIIAEGPPGEIETDPAVREASLWTERIVEVAQAE
jgi:ABC-type branched-subunit amino acid transport system ATPase component